MPVQLDATPRHFIASSSTMPLGTSSASPASSSLRSGQFASQAELFAWQHDRFGEVAIVGAAARLAQHDRLGGGASSSGVDFSAPVSNVGVPTGGVTPFARDQASFSSAVKQQQSAQQAAADRQPQACDWHGKGAPNLSLGIPAGSGTPDVTIANHAVAAQTNARRNRLDRKGRQAADAGRGLKRARNIDEAGR